VDQTGAILAKTAGTVVKQTLKVTV